MTRGTEQHDRAAAASSLRRRSPSDIEDDIRSIRERMDATLDELEFRLSPGQITGGLVDVVRDVIRGNPTPIAHAIRENPIPLVLMGVGAAWFLFTVSRTATLEGRRMPGGEPALSDQRLRIVLTGLVGACRRGGQGVERAIATVADPGIRLRLGEIGGQMDRVAVGLDVELRRYGGLSGPDAPPHPVWRDLHAALDGGSVAPADVLSGLERGLYGTLELFREALHESLPDDLRIAVGARFHELESLEHRVDALREAVS
jgi:hypothetical protein